MDTDPGVVNPLTLPPVVKAVFQFLPAKALCSAASVCSLWRSHAQRCLQQRQQYSWHFFEQEESRSVLDMMRQYFEDIAFRPSAVLVFMTEQQWDYLEEPHTSGQKRKRRDSKGKHRWDVFCQSCLPSSCQVFCSVSPGIVGTSSDLSLTTEREEGVCASMLCFGQHPGLQVCMTGSKPTRQSPHQVQKTEELLGDEVKLLLLMTCLSGCACTIRDLQQAMPDALIVGGIIKIFSLHGQPFDSFGALPCIVALRGAGVRVACVKLDPNVSEVEGAEREILRLRDKTLTFDLRRSVAFMHACVARGRYLYDRHDVEASLFRRHFPATPLLGLFGNGEIGCEFPVPQGACGKDMEMLHSYSTFFTLVSFP